MSKIPSESLPHGAISLTNLGKAYRLYTSKWGRVAEWLGASARHELRWVLQGIDLDIGPGEAVGIVGENGAGKSTLLKLITGVSRPTSGQIAMTGRVSALLELGIGFRDAFTGRQNAIDMLRLTGVPDEDSPELLADIEAFADLGDYFEHPMRTYSSGMQCRLAFATATAIRPDILIVDEALAVGDIFFQQRCYDRIAGFREQGTTLLFVSHSAPAVFTLCDRAVLLRGGRVALDAEPKSVIDLYNATVVAKSLGGDVTVVEPQAELPDQVEVSAGTLGSYSGQGAVLESVTVLQDGRPASAVLTNTAMTVRVCVRFIDSVRDPHVGFQVRDRRGEVIYRTHTHGLGHTLGDVQAGDILEVDYSFENRLTNGDYTLTVGVGAGGKLGGKIADAVLRQQDAASFSVVRSVEDDYWDGIANLQPEVASRRLAAAVSSAPS